MSDVQRVHSLQQWPAILWVARACSHRLPLHAQKVVCTLFVLAHFAAHAQCPPQPVYPPPPSRAREMAPEAPERTLHRDLRAGIADQKNGKCQTHKLFQKRTLSKEDREELRRVIREHAKNKPAHDTRHADHGDY